MRKLIVIGCILISLVILLWGVVKFRAINATAIKQSFSDVREQKCKDDSIKPEADITPANSIVWDNISGGNFDLNTILIQSGNSRVIYLGSNNAVFKTEDGGQTWKSILLINGQNKAVRFLLNDTEDNNSLYAATGNGLFYSLNQGESWKKIFRGKSYLEKECTTVAVLPSGIYLGTKGGFFISKDRGVSWHKQMGGLANSHILNIVVDRRETGYIYAACVQGVFMTKDSGQSWERIFAAQGREENDGDDQEVDDDQDNEEQFSNIRYITIDRNNPDYLFLATSRGVYKSVDKGLNWNLLSSCGLVDRDVRFLLISPDSTLYALTKSGIFKYEGQRWQILSLGLEAGNVRALGLDKQGNLYAACDKGLFRAKIVSYKDSIISGYFKDEPEIDELQKAAIKYAEVEPEKVLRWRKQAAMSAWLPKLSVGMDHDKNKTVSSNIWGTYGTTTTTGKYYAGPDDETRDNNRNWNVSLSWELGDLIWNDAQTSIDTRSRLIVQLRNDILDEVTKIYFERIRVKMEMDNLRIEERKKRFEKELRLQELAASLNALTGGYFSSRIKNIDRIKK
ncbi:MAG: YCF48-related protein [Candidatus Omnitrophota bacterium]